MTPALSFLLVHPVVRVTCHFNITTAEVRIMPMFLGPFDALYCFGKRIKKRRAYRDGINERRQDRDGECCELKDEDGE